MFRPVAIIFLAAVIAAIGRARILVHPARYRSPLDESALESTFDDGKDELSSLTGDQMLGSFSSELFADQFVNVAACRQRCTTKFGEMVKFAIRSPNHYERFENVCNRYNETLRCMDESNAVCFNQQPFNVFTSGLYYMCIEQKKAFEAVIECIDAQAAEVQRECDDKCQTKGKMASWAVHSGLLDNLIGRIVVGASNGVAGFTRDAKQSRINPQFAKRLIQDGCNLVQCQLSCIKVKFNTRCHHNAGTLLSEALVRPLAETQKLLGLSSMQSILNIFMPLQCEFMLSRDVLNKFRIDPKLDENLKRLYENDADKDAAVAATFNMSSLDEVENLKKPPAVSLVNSQFDNDEFIGFDKEADKTSAAEQVQISAKENEITSEENFILTNDKLNDGAEGETTVTEDAADYQIAAVQGSEESQQTV